MASRLDDIFAADQLRQNWDAPAKPELETSQMTRNLSIQRKYQELQRLIEEKFPDCSRLSGRFAELTELIQQTFPLASDAGPADAKQKQAIADMLEQLEELLWAMSLFEDNPT